MIVPMIMKIEMTVIIIMVMIKADADAAGNTNSEIVPAVETLKYRKQDIE